MSRLNVGAVSSAAGAAAGPPCARAWPPAARVRAADNTAQAVQRRRPISNLSAIGMVCPFLAAVPPRTIMALP